MYLPVSASFDSFLVSISVQKSLLLSIIEPLWTSKKVPIQVSYLVVPSPSPNSTSLLFSFFCDMHCTGQRLLGSSMSPHHYHLHSTQWQHKRLKMCFISLLLFFLFFSFFSLLYLLYLFTIRLLTYMSPPHHQHQKGLKTCWYIFLYVFLKVLTFIYN